MVVIFTSTNLGGSLFVVVGFSLTNLGDSLLGVSRYEKFGDMILGIYIPKILWGYDIGDMIYGDILLIL